jgi:hypothetical protein
LFDVFGTVVDWRGSIVRELRGLGRSKGVSADWGAFADAWRRGYHPAMDRVRSGKLPWQSIDVLHRMILDDLLRDFGFRLNESEKRDLNNAWRGLARGGFLRACHVDFPCPQNPWYRLIRSRRGSGQPATQQLSDWQASPVVGRDDNFACAISMS